MSNYKINQPYWHVARVNDPFISQTIFSQLKSNFIVFASWGSHKFVDMGDGLKFNVQGKVAANSKLEKLYRENKYESNNCRTN